MRVRRTGPWVKISCPFSWVQFISFVGQTVGQDLFTGGFQRGNIMHERVPYRGNIDRSVSVDIEVPGVLNDTPWNCLIPRLDIVRKLRNQLADLNNAHTAGILKEIVLLKSGKVMVVALQIVSDTLAIENDFLQNKPVTRFDRAPPRLSGSCLKMICRRSRLSPDPLAASRHPLLPNGTRRAGTGSAEHPCRF